MEQRRSEAETIFLGDLIFEVGMDGCCYDCRYAHHESLVIPANVFAGRNLDDLLPPEAAELIMSTLRAADNGDYTSGSMISLPLSQGAMWFEFSLARKKRADRQEPRFIVQSRNITARKQHQDALRLNSEILNSLTAGIFLVRASDGIIVFTNPQFELLFGYGPGELIGKPVSIVNAPGEHTPESVADSINSELARTGRWSGEVHNIRKDGVAFWCRANVSTFEHATYGKLWVSIHEDISERKTTELAIRKSAEEIEELYNHAACGYHSLDKDGIIRRINDTELEWLGYTRDEIVGKMKFSDMLTPASRPIFQKEFPLFMEQGFVRNVEMEMVRKDGTVLVVLVNATAIYDAGGHFAMSRSTVTDITDRKRVERQLHSLTAHIQTVREEEKAAIAREIHDDLGSTLTALKMESHHLKAGLSQLGNALPLLEHIDTMSQLINAAAGFTRNIISDLRPAILDDLGLLAAIEWQVTQFHERTGIEYLVNCIGDKGNLDKLRSIALFRILQEALTNVARHSGASKVEIEYHHSDEEVLLSISDNGCGLPGNQLAKPGSYGRMGMIERVQQLGGKIRFDVPPGGGLCLMIVLPLPCSERSA